MSVHTDLADLIVRWANVEQVQLTPSLFTLLTASSSVVDRDLVALELPPWAQRAVGAWQEEAA